MLTARASAFALFLIAIAFLAIISTPQTTIAGGGGTFVVTKTTDTADGTCDADCSLREAIIAANGQSGTDTIILSAGTYDLSILGAGENAAATGDLDVTESITIDGVGM
jgi:CSLREA domain-containing protein